MIFFFETEMKKMLLPMAIIVCLFVCFHQGTFKRPPQFERSSQVDSQICMFRNTFQMWQTVVVCYNLFFSFITTDTCDKFTKILLIVSSKDSYVRWYWMLCVQSTKFMVNGWLYFLPRISVLITSMSVFGSFPFTKTFLSLQTNTVHWVTDPAKL